MLFVRLCLCVCVSLHVHHTDSLTKSVSPSPAVAWRLQPSLLWKDLQQSAPPDALLTCNDDGPGAASPVDHEISAILSRQ